MDGIAVTVAERGKLDNAARIDGQIFFKGSHWQCIIFPGQPANNLQVASRCASEIERYRDLPCRPGREAADCTHFVLVWPRCFAIRLLEGVKLSCGIASELALCELCVTVTPSRKDSESRITVYYYGSESHSNLILELHLRVITKK